VRVRSKRSSTPDAIRVAIALPHLAPCPSQARNAMGKPTPSDSPMQPICARSRCGKGFADPTHQPGDRNGNQGSTRLSRLKRLDQQPATRNAQSTGPGYTTVKRRSVHHDASPVFRRITILQGDATFFPAHAKPGGSGSSAAGGPVVVTQPVRSRVVDRFSTGRGCRGNEKTPRVLARRFRDLFRVGDPH
jgi:hypothetical protein